MLGRICGLTAGITAAFAVHSVIIGNYTFAAIFTGLTVFNAINAIKEDD
jgi:hypothetical protein